MKLMRFEGKIHALGCDRMVELAGAFVPEGEAVPRHPLELRISVESPEEAIAICGLLEGTKVADAPVAVAKRPEEKPAVKVDEPADAKKTKRKEAEPPKEEKPAEKPPLATTAPPAGSQLTIPEAKAEAAPAKTNGIKTEQTQETAAKELEPPKVAAAAQDEPGDGNEGYSLSKIPDELKSKTRLPEVIVYLQQHGFHTAEAICKEVERLKATGEVPILNRVVGDVPRRIEQILTTFAS